MFTQPAGITFTAPAPAAPVFEHPPTTEQAAILDQAATGENLVIEAGAGTGKALRDDQPVLTPHGWKPIASLMVGDQVIGSTGLPVKVTGVYPQGIRPLFKVVTSDGITVIADGDHLWTTQTTRDRQKHRDRWETRTTAEIAATLTVQHGDRDRPNHYLPMLSAPIDGPDVVCPLDPWLVGVLIGDGQLSGGIGLSNPDPDVLARVRAVLPDGVELAPQSTTAPNGKDWRITSRGATKPGHRGMWNPVTAALRDLGLYGKLSHEKTVPEILLHASARQRHELLTGLMDSDGYAAGHEAEFSTTSPVLAGQLVWLVQSLGGTAHTSHRPAPTYSYKGEQRTGREAWRVYISLPAEIRPFAYSAKATRYTPRSKYPPRRQIVAIEPVEADSATCISVDAPDQLYVTHGCVLTHNTSTLKMVAAAAPMRRGLYLAYNKAIAEDARASFPANVRCATAHSLAFQAVGRSYSHRLNGPRLPARETARLLGIPAVLDLGASALTAPKVARIVTDSIARFCHSADDQPEYWHIPQVPGLDAEPLVMTELRTKVLPMVHQAWADLSSVDGKLRFTHDCYLKMWALTRPALPAELIFLDEAQDANPLIASVVNAQPSQKILVGDQSQAIYGWRGAVDAMETFEGARFQLSQSFRFGQRIADEANVWLELLGAPLRLTGNPNRTSQLERIPHPRAVLCRTNAGAIGQAMAALGSGHRPALVGGGDDIRRLAEACRDLRTGRPTYHPELMAFTSWGEVQEYALLDAGGQDLKVLVKLVDAHGPDAIIRIVNQLVDEHNADVVISTAHKAKGREWPTVRLAMDFPEPIDPKTGALIPAEAMLSYVAVTRAQDGLDRTALFTGGEKGVHTVDTPEPLPANQLPLDVLVPDPEPISTDLPAALVGWLTVAKEARENKTRWAEIEAQAIEKLKDWLGDREEATVNGRPAITYRPSAPAMQLDGKALQKDHPDIYAAYAKPKKAARPFNITGEWK